MTKDTIPSPPVINMTTCINAPASKVWAMLTSPALMKLWIFETEVEVISDWRPGSPVIFRGDFHGLQYEDKGMILAFDPEKTFRYSYLSQISKLPDEPENYSIIAFNLTTKGAQTILSLTQRNFVTDTIYRHFYFYWLVTLDIMKKLLEQ